MSPLLGPADPEQFRQTIGRARHYIDPLPGDAIAPATDQYFVSVSGIKSVADPFAFGNYSLANRLVAALTENPHRLDGLPPDELRAAILTIDSLGLKRAGQRGTTVHDIADALLTGRVPLIVEGTPGAEYRPALVDFIETFQPELIYSEVPIFNRTLHGCGYAGTLDAIVRIEGKLYLLDWKSRAPETEHTAYGGEAAQVAAYANAEYYIIGGPDGNPVRILPPQLDGGLIVSVKETGCVPFPINLTAGFDLFSAMAQWVPAKRAERQAIGRRWAPRRGKASPVAATPAIEPVAPAPPVLVELTPAAQGALLASNPDEGPLIAASDVAALRGRYERLAPNERAWLNALAESAAQHGFAFHMSRVHTVRRFELMRALVSLAPVISGQSDAGDTLRMVLAVQLGDTARMPALDPGRLIGSLDSEAAKIFAEHVDAFLFGIVGARVDDDGTVSLQFPAA
jgi:hypothetical protein